MTEAIRRQIRKNPILRSRAPTLPPAMRSRTALGLLRGAAVGRLELQHCAACGTVQYPPREACVACLSTALTWSATSGRGETLSETRLHHSQELFFRERVPWRLGLVRLEAGVTVVAYLHRDCPPAPAAVVVATALDRAGQAVLVAMPEGGGGSRLADDPQLREFTADPRGRNVLVTDATSPFGQAMVRAMLAAGANSVWAGQCEPWRSPPGWPEVAALPNVTPVWLDVTDTRSIDTAAAELGAKVDILITPATRLRSHGLLGPFGVDAAQADMEVNCFGLMRLARAFGPVMRARGADGVSAGGASPDGASADGTSAGRASAGAATAGRAVAGGAWAGGAAASRLSADGAADGAVARAAAAGGASPDGASPDGVWAGGAWAGGASGAVAWVNLLSIHALSGVPAQATHAASMAAALSVSQALRAELRAGGIRVINVFPGPLDDAWNQLTLPPKLAPAALARAVVAALEGSVEDLFPGDVAVEWLARYRDNPKALEQELGQ